MTDADRPNRDDEDDFVRQLGLAWMPHLLRRLSDSFVAAVAQSAEETGLRVPPRTTSTLLLLHRRGDHSMTEIATSLRQSHQLVMTWIRQLEQLGLVRSEPDPFDGRRRLLKLTAEGRKEAQRVEEQSGFWAAAYEKLMKDSNVDLISDLRRLEDSCAERSFLQRLRDEQSR